MSGRHVGRDPCALLVAPAAEAGLDELQVVLAWNVQAELRPQLVELGPHVAQLQLVEERQPFHRGGRDHQANRQQHDQQHEARRQGRGGVAIAAALRRGSSDRAAGRRRPTGPPETAARRSPPSRGRTRPRSRSGSRPAPETKPSATWRILAAARCRRRTSIRLFAGGGGCLDSTGRRGWPKVRRRCSPSSPARVTMWARSSECNPVSFPSATPASGARPRSTCPRFIAKPAELGFPAVMLAGKRPHLSPLDADAGAARRSCKATAGRARVACAVVAAYTDLSPAAAGRSAATWRCRSPTSSRWPASRAGSGRKVVRVFTAYEAPGQSRRRSGTRRGPRAARNVRPGRGARRDDRDPEPPRRRRAHRRAAGTARRRRPAELQARLRRLVAGAARRGSVSSGQEGGPAHGHHHERRLHPPAALPLSAGLVNYERIEPDLVRAVRSATGFIDYAAFFRGLRDGGFDGMRPTKCARRSAAAAPWKTSTPTPPLSPLDARAGFCEVTGSGVSRAEVGIHQVTTSPEKDSRPLCHNPGQ